VYISYYNNHNFLVLKENQELHIVKLVISVLNPFISWALLVLVYICIRKWRKKSIRGNISFKRNITVLFLIITFMLQPDIIMRCLEMFR